MKRRVFLKFLRSISLSQGLQWIFPLKAFAGGIIPFAFLKKSAPKTGLVTNGLQMHLDAGNASSYSGTGATWTDLSGNANHGTLYGAPVYTSGTTGNFTFTGGSSSGTQSVGTPVLLGATNFTINMIVNLSSPQVSYWTALWGDDFYNSNKGFWAVFTGNTSGVLFDSAAYYNTSNTVSASDPRNQIVSYDFTLQNSINAVVYINGILIKSFNINMGNAVTASGLGLYLMTRHKNDNSGFENWMAGKLYSVKVYNRTLSQSEITQNYNNIKTRYSLP